MARRTIIAECRFCGNNRKLCRSHVIPEWAYRPIYDAQSTAILYSSPNRRRRKVQVGHREYLLCQDCEAHFERIERPFLDFWAAPGRFPAVLDQEYLQVSGIDHTNTSLFLLSVLWRAHYAKDEMLSSVDLGPHLTKMRALLSKPDANALASYPIFGFALRDPDNKTLASWFVFTPIRCRTDGIWNYEVGLLGCAWKVFVSRSLPALPDRCRLSSEGTITLPIIDYPAYPAIQHLLGP